MTNWREGLLLLAMAAFALFAGRVIVDIIFEMVVRGGMVL